MTQPELFYLDPEPSKLELAFWKFHQANPKVYEKLVDLARKWRRRDVRRIGIATVFETARYTLNMGVGEDGFKMSNNHRAFYARLIMRNEPDLKDIFSVKKQSVESTL